MEGEGRTHLLGQPQPRLRLFSSPSFLCMHHCTAPQKQSRLVGAVPEKGQALRLWNQGSYPGARPGQEWAWWRGPQGVCPEPQGQPGAWRGACASVAGIGTQRYEDPRGFSRLGGVGVAPSSVVLPARLGPCCAWVPFLPDPR